MANDFIKNPNFLDAAGTGTKRVKIHSILIKPTAAAWVIDIREGSTSGKPVLNLVNSTEVAFQVMFPPNYSVNGIHIETITNCDAYLYEA
jgi:hypothetical protein